MKGEIETSITDFTSGCEFLISIFNDNACRKWNKDHYEKRFNRAIFDAFIYYFSDNKIISLLKGKENEIENAYKELCSSSDVFLESVGVSTKKVISVFNRIYIIGKMLNDKFDLSISLPSLNNNKIIVQ